MELNVTLHGQHAATLDAEDDRWLHARTTSMGAMSARISAAWTEKPATRQLNGWLDGCLPENGLLARYRARAQSMLQAVGVAYETPKVAEILWANADAEFAGAVRFDTDRSPKRRGDVSGYERLTESEIGNRLGEADRIARGVATRNESCHTPSEGIALSGHARQDWPDHARGRRLGRCIRSRAQYLDREGGGQPQTARRGGHRSDLPASVRGCSGSMRAPSCDARRPCWGLAQRRG